MGTAVPCLAAAALEAPRPTGAGSARSGAARAEPRPLGGAAASVFQKLGSLSSEPALPSTSYLPATPSAVPASSYIPSSETPPGEQGVAHVALFWVSGLLSRVSFLSPAAGSGALNLRSQLLCAFLGHTGAAPQAAAGARLSPRFRRKVSEA